VSGRTGDQSHPVETHEDGLDPEEKLLGLGRTLLALSPDPAYADDVFVLAATREAFASARAGNFGIGAVIVGPEGRIITRGRNRVFTPTFRSDLHAEMDALNNLERRRPNAEVSRLTLFGSLEACPMCLARLITAGLGAVRFAAADPEGGMASRLTQLPPVWRKLASYQSFGPAVCSPAVRELAWQIASATLDQNNERLIQRRKPHPSTELG
jgi:tRNA(adenine34) deaminase